ncbi:hypothetical protein NMG60_11034876 [Bertholletia excelsa]
MAPSRRKGGSRASATAAAAARRQWKVGDLVLAKVKGFPPWPATVSEPEKWGYSADWKKVLVYFFGTQQIAFCNPADVEEFTEEKKESLLVKRHGKGADFVRAVCEIIESYEKLKNQDRMVVDVNSVDEVTAANSVNSVSDCALKNHLGAHSEILNLCLKNSYPTGDQNGSSLLVGGGADPSVLCDGEMLFEECVDNLVIKGKPLATKFCSKRFGGVQQQNSGSEKRDQSTHRSRSSTRGEASRFQKFMLPSNNSSGTGGEMTLKALQDGSVRRSKRIRKSPDVSEGHDTGSPANLSSNSIEDTEIEMVTGDSDTISLTDGSTVESGCKLMQPEIIVESCEGDVESSQILDFQTNPVIMKKKRKVDGKQGTSDGYEASGRAREGRRSEIKAHIDGQNSPNCHGKMNERYSKEDGDEHLPLVKRARVRMGRPSATGGELDMVTQSEEKSQEVSNSCSWKILTSFNCENVAADEKSLMVKGDKDNCSLRDKFPQASLDKPHICEVKKNQQLGSSADGEAALPPSKRLHRALEAMSANAAEDVQTEAPLSTKTFNNGCYFSSIRDSPYVCKENNVENGFREHSEDAFRNNVSQAGTSNFFVSSGLTIPNGSAKIFAETAIHNGPIRSSSSLDCKSGKDMDAEAANHTDLRGVNALSSGIATTEDVVVAQRPQPLSSGSEREQACGGSVQDSVAQAQTLEEEHKSENPDLSNYKAEDFVNELDPSEYFRRSLNPVSGAVNVENSAKKDNNMLPCVTRRNYSRTTEVSKLPVHANDKADTLCQVVEEIKLAQMVFGDDLTPSSAKVVADAADCPLNLSCSTSISDDQLCDKPVCGIPSSSSPAEGLDSSAHASPPSTLVDNISRLDSINFLRNNGCCSPDVQLHNVRSTVVGKTCNKAEATAALASFEAVLGTLTRTKESIGRATRIAIDCAKFGIAAKVVEVLVRNLESESSLHKRVDLFFLVDSITQCSRSLKGDVGDMYACAIKGVLPRILLAAAPPGSSAQENRRQCLKVLRLWLERKVLPDSIIRYHIRDLESLSGSSSSGAFSRRPLRTERAFDDPIREMEGMLVDEYGSNSSFQLLGFCMPPMLKDEGGGSDSDSENFEAVTPEHNPTLEEQERIPTPAISSKHRHILEDVDGELEMEDVAPTCEVEMSCTNNGSINTAQNMHPQFENPISLAPPLPKDVPPPLPPLPSSPPPPPPPPQPPALPPLTPMPDPISNGLDSKLYVGAQNMKENLYQNVVQQPIVPRTNSGISDAVCYQAPESRDVQMQTRLIESASSCSFGSLPVSQPSIQLINNSQPVNNHQQNDGTTFHSKAYHLRPPQPAPSNQFSYVNADNRVKLLRDVPPPTYPNRVHFVESREHDRIKLAPREFRETWRFAGPSYSGTYWPDNARGAYPHAPYSDQPCERPVPDHRWGYSLPAMNYRESISCRPPYEDPIPVATGAPSLWRPR